MKQIIEQRLAEFRQQAQQLQANLNALQGAIQFAEHLLAVGGAQETLPVQDAIPAVVENK